MAVELDSVDSRILTALLRDGRAPAAQIADEVGLSRPAVAERISRLEKQGVIRGTTVVVEPSALGRSVTAFIAARGTIGKQSEKAFRDLMAWEEVLEVHSVAGEDCFFIKVRTDSIPSLNQLVSRMTSPPLALTTRTTIVLETHCEKVGGIALGGRE